MYVFIILTHKCQHALIYCETLSDIPVDAEGVMAVPVTILKELHTEQFVVLDLLGDFQIEGKPEAVPFSRCLVKWKR
ncbi:MAG: adenine-specific methyltransferase EcoRI family protein [Planctomycetaceae bacterium]|jgi:hypothetical protein|nr:adenine-specific methyltransferase EcoRI family protein [Planctomycetaceae bacterium]